MIPDQRNVRSLWWRRPRALWHAVVLIIIAASIPLADRIQAQTPEAAAPTRDQDSHPVVRRKGDSGSITNKSNPQLEEAQELLRQNRVNEAEVTTRSYLTEVPSSSEGHILLGFILFQKDMPADSLRALAEVKDSRNPSAFAVKIVGLDYARLEQYAEADRWLSMALRLQPQDPAGWQWLGDVKVRESRYDGAVACYQRSIDLDPDNVSSQNALGVLYESMGRREEAIAALRKAVYSESKTEPVDPVPYYNLGRFLVEQHKGQDALPNLTEALKIDPDSSEGHEELAKAYSLLNRYTDAEQEFRRAISLKPDKPSLHYQLGQLYKKLGESENAEQEFSQFRALSAPGSPMSK